MHWFFAKKDKNKEIKPIPGPEHRPRTRYTRRSTARPAPKPKTKTLSKPRPRPLTRKAVPVGTLNQLKTRLESQLREMKQSTNKLRQANENRHDLLRFIRNGIPKPRAQQKNRV
jgi:hypothetical protein